MIYQNLRILRNRKVCLNQTLKVFKIPNNKNSDSELNPVNYLSKLKEIKTNTDFHNETKIISKSNSNEYTTLELTKDYSGFNIFDGRYSHLDEYRNESINSIISKGVDVPERLNSLIKERGLRGMTKECLEILSEMKRLKIPISTETYNNCLIGCMKSKNAKLSRYLFLCLRSDILTPDLRTYTLMINTHINAGDITSAFSLYKKMETEGTKADLVVFSVLINCLVENKQMNAAWQFFNYMRTWRLIEPDEVLFTIMIKGCVYSREAEKAMNLYQEMLTLKKYPTIYTYIQLINCLSNRKEYFNQCFQFYNNMKSQEYPINEKILTYLLRSCCSVGNSRKARELLIESSNMKIKPTLEMYLTYIKTLAKQMKLYKLSDNEKINIINKTWSIVQTILSKNILMINQNNNSSSVKRQENNNNMDENNINNLELLNNKVVSENNLKQLYNNYYNYEKKQDNNNNTNENNIDCKENELLEMQNNNLENENNNTSSINKDITRLLNSVILVYENANYYDYAIEVLNCFQRFNAKPDYMTYFILLRMLGPKMKDPGRFFALWNQSKTVIEPQRTLLCMALDMAILSRSAKRTLEILNDMYNAKVFPTHNLMKKLYESGKKITQIHIMINNLVTLQRKITYQEKMNENKILQTYIDEHELNKHLITENQM